MSDHTHDEKSDELELSLVDSLCNSDLSGIAADLGEVGLDSMLDDGLLKDVPFLGVFAKLYNLAGSVSNRMFLKKMLKFLTNIADVPLEQRREQIAKLTVDRQHQRRVGENLMLLIDKLNTMEKPEMLALAFRAYLEQQIDVETFSNLAYAIEIVRIGSLEKLKAVYDETNPGRRLAMLANATMVADPDLQHFAICGLVSISWESLDSLKRPTSADGGGYKVNELGKTFCDVILFRKKEF